MDEAAQQVAPDVVGAQQVRGRGGLQAVAQVDLADAQSLWRIHGHAWKWTFSFTPAPRRTPPATPVAGRGNGDPTNSGGFTI